MAQYIDIHVASPNGPSNHLFIELPAPGPEECAVAGGFRWGLPTVYGAHYKFDSTNTKTPFSFVPGDGIFPPTGELVIQVPPSFGAPPTASLVLTVEMGGKVLATYTPTTITKPQPLTFDVRRNAYVLLGTDFLSANTELSNIVAGALNNGFNGAPVGKPTQPIIVSGKLVTGASPALAYPIDSKLTVGLQEVTAP